MIRKILLVAMVLMTGTVLLNSCRKPEIANLPDKQASSLAMVNLFQGLSGDAFARTPFVSTIAGNDNAGMIDGIGTEAEFNVPRNLVVDPAGNIFVTDP